MLKTPESVIASFGSFLTEKNVPIASHNYYKKCLRYYLDFCHKYRFYSLNPASLPNFLNKLKEKKQTGIQQKQAHESIRLFWELASQQSDIKGVLDSINQQNNVTKDNVITKIHANDSFLKENLLDNIRKPKIDKEEINCNWQRIYDELNNEIKVRHYSPKTLKSYLIWARKFQGHSDVRTTMIYTHTIKSQTTKEAKSPLDF